jgi:hypothetical protein
MDDRSAIPFHLPDEIWLMITSHLSAFDWKQVRRTCRGLNKLTTPLLFQRVYFELCGLACESLYDISCHRALSLCVKTLVLTAIDNSPSSKLGFRAHINQAILATSWLLQVVPITTITSRPATVCYRILHGSHCQRNSRRHSTMITRRIASRHKGRFGIYRTNCVSGRQVLRSRRWFTLTGLLVLHRQTLLVNSS